VIFRWVFSARGSFFLAVGAESLMSAFTCPGKQEYLWMDGLVIKAAG